MPRPESEYEAPSTKELADFLTSDSEEETVDTTEESQSETVQDEQTQSQDGDTEAESESTDEPSDDDTALTKMPRLDTHPRFVRLIQQKKEAEERARKLEEALAEAKPAPSPIMQDDDETPSVEFIKLFGDNPEAWKHFKRMQDVNNQKAVTLAEQKFQAVLAKEREEQQREAQRREQVISKLEDDFAEMSDEAGVDLTNQKSTVRNQILNIVEEYGLLDAAGVPNLRSAYRLHQKLYPKVQQNVEERKKVVAKTNAKTNSNVEEIITYTPQRIKEIMQRGGVGFLENS